MKIFLKGITFILCVYVLTVATGCKRLEDGTPVASYDVTNSIFRVHAVTDAGIPYHVIVTEENAGKSANIIDVQQNNGGDFNYGFTPAIGSTVNVQIAANSVVECYAFYKGTNFGLISMTASENGDYAGKLSYTVNK